mmetsp:Transcript_11021/g.17648  ORF Transcript_11021/g.17648 Transcript_11021/m.17648 type:complete len:193 (-) Transcript_11021:153-731(-)
MMRNAIFAAIAMAAAVLTVMHMQGERSLATGVTRRAAFRGATLPRNAISGGIAPKDIRTALSSSKKITCMETGTGAAVCNNGLVVLRGSRTSIKAEKEADFDADQVIGDLKTKLDGIEDKPKAALVVAGAVAALTVGNAVVTTIDNLPLLPGLMKLVGTTYSLWFAYRNLLFETSRKELGEDLDALWKKITG